MSLPNFPNIDPPIQREDAVNQILSSIAMEELSLSHILNAEGEKLQYILGTLPGLSGPAATVEDVLSANKSVRNLLKTAVQNQLFLKSKMQGALEASSLRGPAGPTGPTGPIIIDFAYAANTGAAAIPVNGLVPLPNDQVKAKDISISPDNAKFTVKAAGVYQVAYDINTDKALTAGARLLVNGEPSQVSAVGGISTLSLSRLSNEVLLRLGDNDEISLQIFNNPLGTVLLPAPVGASLRIVRLS